MSSMIKNGTKGLSEFWRTWKIKIKLNFEFFMGSDFGWKVLIWFGGGVGVYSNTMYIKYLGRSQSN